eukprot:Blabericola_migrator_1__13229@NODE_918_length_6062_cov_180_926939_g639_i0_p1_GENE_NODE_918_length_6062_cov_180_926939_g639_i0NODE_918_length_6062_cov_180_926939_g639_i0_p1_ORF_typecomplete_len1271_score287_17SNF2_N/PF00176_23/1e77HDA23/PF11496_8/3_2e23Helicase_C/PF00271_31/1_3e04Helicase_C/PF00271_31/7_5e20ResIII/PF04851_15/7_8e03ResIII/PF04851_15/4_6e14ERCC3_RAD25_C/PF16203_5/8_3e02ERCC3_RAD25_C/PF16203_5/2e05DEAD/PF00270_29/3_9e03DEAD/PF00270_29/0_00015PaREP1/PF05942_11/0_33PaREP1/PF05942_11/1
MSEKINDSGISSETELSKERVHEEIRNLVAAQAATCPLGVEERLKQLKREYASLGVSERKAFDSIQRLVCQALHLPRIELGDKTHTDDRPPPPKAEVVPEDGMEDVTQPAQATDQQQKTRPPVKRVQELLVYGQLLLCTFRHLNRGLLPTSDVLNRLMGMLPSDLRAQMAEESRKACAMATQKKRVMSRAQLASRVLKEDPGSGGSLSKFVFVPHDVGPEVRQAARLENLRRLQEALANKFLKKSFKTPDQIYKYIVNNESSCSLASLQGRRPSASQPDKSSKDSPDDVQLKLEMLLGASIIKGPPIQGPRMPTAAPPATQSRLGGARWKRTNANKIFMSFSVLRQHEIPPHNLQLSRTAQIRHELSYTIRNFNDQTRQAKEIFKAIARSAAAKVAADELDRQKRAERETRERMRALKENDMESYKKLIKQTKNKRIEDLLSNTERLLQDIGAKMSLETSTYEKARQKEQERAAEAEATAATEPTESTEEPVKEKAQYYTLSHRIRERVVQPESIQGGKLMPYQLAGLDFLVSLYNNNISGILADEMGLGKTIQTIALLAYLKDYKRCPGPHLVAVPLTTLPNWAAEMEKWCPTLKVFQFRGDKMERRELRSEVRKCRYNVLLTTFEYILKEKKTLMAPHWRFIIVDEGHKMKNVKSKFHVTLGEFKSTHRLLLTGTPLQNNLNELWSLLNFLMPQTFSSSEDFERWFEEPFKDQFVEASKEDVSLTEEEKLVVINRLHLVLRPFLLRRVKADVLSDLPSKREYIVRIQLTKWQQLVYEQLVNRCLKVRDASGKITSKAVSNVIMQLRKIVNHPYLFLDQYKVDDNLWRTSGKFELLDRMLPKLVAFKHKILIFCQMTQLMDILGDYFLTKGYRYHRLDGSMVLQERQDRMDEFNRPDSDIYIFMLSTRAGGLGLNLQAADTVIIFDSDWNPHQDLQAQARAHRVGQRNEVRVFRFVTRSPVEELILSRAQHKLSIDEQIIQAGMFSNKFNETEREEKLRNLLSQKEHKETVQVTSPNELNLYIARNPEEEEFCDNLDRELFGNEVYTEFFEHDLDDSEGAQSQSANSAGPAGSEADAAGTFTDNDPPSESGATVAEGRLNNSGPTPSATAAKDSSRIENLLITSGRLISEDEIPNDILLIQNVPKDEESFFGVQQELGVRRSRLRAMQSLSQKSHEDSGGSGGEDDEENDEDIDDEALIAQNEASDEDVASESDSKPVTRGRPSRAHTTDTQDPDSADLSGGRRRHLKRSSASGLRATPEVKRRRGLRS